MTPEARRDRAAILRHEGVAPASDRVLAAFRSLAVFLAFAFPSGAYLHARVMAGVQSPEKDASSELFTATLNA